MRNLRTGTEYNFLCIGYAEMWNLLKHHTILITSMKMCDDECKYTLIKQYSGQKVQRMAAVKEPDNCTKYI